MAGRSKQSAAATRSATPWSRPVGSRRRSRPKRAADPFTTELRRRDVLPLLVLHLINEGPSYGNQLMERIAAMTAGVLSSANTMYPLLRQLEGAA